MSTTSIQIRNTTASPINFNTTGLVIEGLTNTGQLPALSTKTVYAMPDEVWHDVQLRGHVLSGAAVVVMGGIDVPQSIAMQFFDVSWNAQAITPARFITSTVSPANEILPNDTLIYADPATAGGSISISLPLASTVPKGKRITVHHYTDGVLTITPKSGSAQIRIFASLSSNVSVSLTGATYTFTFDGSVWLMEMTNGNQYAHRWAGTEYQPIILIQSLLAADINDWDILTTYPNGRHFRIASSTNIEITGIVNPDITQERVIQFTVIGNNDIKFKNNSGLSAAANRFSIGSDIKVKAATYPMPRFFYNTQGQKWLK